MEAEMLEIWSRRGAARRRQLAPHRVAMAIAIFAGLVVVPAGPASAAYRDIVLGTSGVVSYWRLGETAGTTAADARGLNPGVYYGPVLGQTGALPGSTDKSVVLDGVDDSVQVPDSASVDLGNVFTLEAWVKRGALGGEQVILSKPAGGYYFWFAYDYLALNKAVQTGASKIVAATVPITDTTRWHHVVATKNGSAAKLYIDGVDRSGPVTDVPVLDTTSALSMGAACPGCGGQFKGGLDEVAIYKRALTGTEIRQHYQAGIDPRPNTTITSSPPPPSTASTTALFSFTSSEAASTFQCRLDTAAYTSCTSPKGYGGLAAGSHTFSVRAVDSAGQEDVSPATATWTVTPCPPAFGAFKAGVWPPACWRPYADGTPFNQPIPTNPRLNLNSAQIVSMVNNLWSTDGKTGPTDIPAGVADTPHDFWHPTYYAQPTDPIYTIDCTAPWGTCELEHPDISVRVPVAARAAGGSDGSMTVVDQANGWEYDFWQVASKPAGGGTITISWGGRTRIGTPESDGLGVMPDDTGADAASVGLLAGIIRAQEMEAGQINHALYMVVGCDAGQSTGVYPAPPTADGAACPAELRQFAPVMGQRFQLNMTDQEINALGVPPWRKTILRAMARYGMYVGDTSAQPRWFVGIESGSTYTSFGDEDRFVTFARSHQSEGGIAFWNGQGDSTYNNENYVFDLHSGVPWDRLRLIDPCVARNNCS